MMVPCCQWPFACGTSVILGIHSDSPQWPPETLAPGGLSGSVMQSYDQTCRSVFFQSHGTNSNLA